MRKIAAIWALASALCIAVDRIYAIFSHGVASFAMDTMFLIPLAGMALPAWIASNIPSKRANPNGRAALNLYGSALATAAAGRMYDGIHYIAGGDAKWAPAFYEAAAALALSSALVWLAGRQSNR